MNLAYKYAIAFLNVYNDRLTFNDIERIEKAACFLQEHPRALFLLQVQLIKRSIKEQGLRQMARRYGLTQAIDHLFSLLLEHNRAYMVADVLKAIVYQYQKRNTIMRFMVSSSLPLTEAERHQVEQFIDRQLPGTHYYAYKVDQTLIAGIRIASDTIIWEFSIDKSLRELAHRFGQ